MSGAQQATTKMASTVRELLSNIGTTIEEMDPGELYEVPGNGDAYEDLAVEKIRPDRISLAHYHKRNGDLCRDPEAVFALTDDGELQLIRHLIQNGLAVKDDYDEDGITDPAITVAVNEWGERLHHQGHVEQANNIEPKSN